MTAAEMKSMRPANDPERGTCPKCGGHVLQVLVRGTSVLLDHRELDPDEAIGLAVAVGPDGEARAVRLPSSALRNGEAIYRPHELSCP